MCALHKVGVIMHSAGGVGILQQCTEVRRIRLKCGEITDYSLKPQYFGASVHHINRLGMTLGRNKELQPVGLEPVAHGHGLRSGSALIQEGCVGDIQAGEVNHHGLECKQRLEAPLRDFGLVRGVLGVPTGVLQHVSL